MTSSLPRPIRTAFLLPALLAATAVVLGGLAGVLLGFTALLLTLDRLLDRTYAGASMVDPEHRFAALVRQHRRAALAQRLRRRPAGGDELAYLPVDAGWAA